jgi:predicted nucleic acid-binding protein
MTRPFVDAFYHTALLNPRDRHHDEVLANDAGLAGEIATTDAVLLEVANTFAGTPFRSKAAEPVSAERTSQSVSVIPISPELFTRGLDLYTRRPDKRWSLTDCVSFLVMADEGITDALTADHHFEQAGFRAVFAKGS